MPVRHQLDGGLPRPMDADEVERVDPEHACHADARKHACVIRLRQVLDVVQAPAREAPGPVVVAGAQGERGERSPQVDPVLRVRAQEEGRRLVDDPRLVEIAEVQRSLARPFDRRVAERLLAEAVGGAVRGAAVFPEAEIEAVVGLVGRARDDVERGNELALAQRDEGVQLGGLVGLHHRHLGLAQRRPASGGLPGRQLEIERKPRRGIDAHGREEAADELRGRRSLGTERQWLGPRRVRRHVGARPRFLLAQQLGQAGRVGGDKARQRFDPDRRPARELGQHRERRPGAEGVIAPRQRGAAKQVRADQYRSARDQTPCPGPVVDAHCSLYRTRRWRLSTPLFRLKSEA